MDQQLFSALTACETDVEGALKRFSDNADLYQSFLISFLTEPTMSSLESAITLNKWDDAFLAAHELKGLAGNLGFIPLFHATAELVLLLRAGKTKDIDDSYQQIKQSYNNIITAIKSTTV